MIGSLASLRRNPGINENMRSCTNVYSPHDPSHASHDRRPESKRHIDRYPAKGSLIRRRFHAGSRAAQALGNILALSSAYFIYAALADNECGAQAIRRPPANRPAIRTGPRYQPPPSFNLPGPLGAGIGRIADYPRGSSSELHESFSRYEISKVSLEARDLTNAIHRVAAHFLGYVQPDRTDRSARELLALALRRLPDKEETELLESLTQFKSTPLSEEFRTQFPKYQSVIAHLQNLGFERASESFLRPLEYISRVILAWQQNKNLLIALDSVANSYGQIFISKDTPLPNQDLLALDLGRLPNKDDIEALELVTAQESTPLDDSFRAQFLDVQNAMVALKALSAKDLDSWHSTACILPPPAELRTQLFFAMRNGGSLEEVFRKAVGDNLRYYVRANSSQLDPGLLALSLNRLPTAGEIKLLESLARIEVAPVSGEFKSHFSRYQEIIDWLERIRETGATICLPSPSTFRSSVSKCLKESGSMRTALASAGDPILQDLVPSGSQFPSEGLLALALNRLPDENDVLMIESSTGRVPRPMPEAFRLFFLECRTAMASLPQVIDGERFKDWDNFTDDDGYGICFIPNSDIFRFEFMAAWKEKGTLFKGLGAVAEKYRALYSADESGRLDPRFVTLVLNRIPTARDIQAVEFLTQAKMSQLSAPDGAVIETLLNALHLAGPAGTKLRWQFAKACKESGDLTVACELAAQRQFGAVLGTRDPVRTANLLGIDYGPPSLTNTLAALSHFAPAYRDSLARVYVFDGVLESNIVLRTIGGALSVSPIELASTLNAQQDSVLVLNDWDREKVERLFIGATVPRNKLRTTSEFLKSEKMAAFNEIEFSGSERVLHTRHASTPEGRELRTQIVNLTTDMKHPAFGDSIIVQFPNRHLLLIDTGSDAKCIQRVIERIRTIGPDTNHGLLTIDVVITHAHRDHIGGLKCLLDDAPKNNLQVNSIIFGQHTNPSRSAQKLLARLRAEYSEDPVSDGVRVFRNRIPKDQKEKTLRISHIQTPRGTSVAIENTGGAEVRLLQVDNPENENESSIVVHLSIRGVSYLFTGDLDVDGLEKLMYLFPNNLKADILKWPHHVSYRGDLTRGNRQTLATFLRAVDPHTIFFSNQGFGQTAEMESAATQFIHETLDSHGFKTNIESTNDWEEPSNRQHLQREVRLRHADDQIYFIAME